MNKVFTYTVVIYSSSYCKEDGYCLESGLLVADSYTSAMNQLEDYYTNLVRIVDLAETNNSMIILPSNVVYDYARDEYDECATPCNKWGNKLTAERDNTETATDTKIIQESVDSEI